MHPWRHLPGCCRAQRTAPSAPGGLTYRTRTAVPRGLERPGQRRYHRRAGTPWPPPVGGRAEAARRMGRGTQSAGDSAMRGIVTESRPTGLLAAGVLAAVLATGWSGGSPRRHKATVNSCYAFSVGALQRHIKVTAVPPACAGLSHAQINLAVARAVRTVIGSRPKPAARRAAIGASRYLAHLIETVPPPKPAAPPAPPPPSRNSPFRSAWRRWLPGSPRRPRAAT